MFRALPRRLLQPRKDLCETFACSARSCCSSATPKKSIYMSLSSDVTTNLAFESWMYQNYSFEDQSVLFLWVNNPAVVIGRHQNPWTEANMPHLVKSGVQLARRQSGGGAVFHDLGNLNCTFFTSRERYHRRTNLELICQALRNEWNLDVTVSTREDIVLNEAFKISGTASKLGHKSAYHHCTLLVNTDSTKILQCLTPVRMGIECKATASVRSQTGCLAHYNPEITMARVKQVVGQQFVGHAKPFPNSAVLVEPSERDFPGLNQIRDDISSWQWVFGKTPRFAVRWPTGDSNHFYIEVQHGVIEALDLSHWGVSDLDSKIWREALVKQKLGRSLYELLKSECAISGLQDEANTNFKHILGLLCSTTV